ncbi:hypothetical protein [Dyella sp. AtDHG13]|uniref:hypothetical protein n=1 Tax=Dyella sp. AtDHG13 TaxID=1938897 RepID=UPI000942EED0|nr:hypothetical protein [Dyella sp. AtDHG13]
MTEPLMDNAKKCLDMLHKLLGVWFVLIVASAYLPPSARIKLPFTDITAPGDSVRWACLFAIFFIGLIAHAIVSMLVRLCITIEKTEEIEAAFTYPSVATLGSPPARAMFGIGLAFVQHMVAATVLPQWKFWGGDIWLGVAFAFSTPMIFFGSKLASWQHTVIKGIEEKASKENPLPDSA